jgi:hypothetical protein
VIVVAKSAFRTATHAIPVLRCTSPCPLYVMTAAMPVPTPTTSSGTWPTGTGCTMPCAAAGILAHSGLP